MSPTTHQKRKQAKKKARERRLARQRGLKKGGTMAPVRGHLAGLMSVLQPDRNQFK